jgi:hypothetical protein
MSIKTFSRRQFLTSASGAALALPVLPSLLEGRALAATAETAAKTKRLICIQVGHGMFPEEWFPWVGEAVKNASAVLKVTPMDLLAPAAEQIRELDLTKLDQISPVLASFDQTLRKKMMIINGLSAVDAGGHNRSGMLAGYIPTAERPGYTGESIDTIISRKVYAGTPVAPIVRLGELDGPGMSLVEGANGVVPGASYMDTGAVKEMLFGAMRRNTGSGSRAKLENDTLADFLVNDLKKSMKTPGLSGEDRKRLEAHVDFVHEYQKRLAATAGLTCTPPAPQPSYINVFNQPIVGPELMDDLHSAYFDTIVAGIKCDISNVYSLSAGMCDAWEFLGVVHDYHGACHARDLTNITPVRKFMFDRIAKMMTDLMEVEDPETGRTYLDNTLIMIVSEICPYAHARTDLNIMLAGNVDDYFKMGRLVSFQNYKELSWDLALFGGRPYSRLLYTVLDAFGLKPEDYTTFKPENNGAAGNQQLTQLNDWQTPLPFMRSSTG